MDITSLIIIDLHEWYQIRTDGKTDKRYCRAVKFYVANLFFYGNNTIANKGL